MTGMQRGWSFMTRYKKGTVVMVLFPNSDLATAKRRPALVVQADEHRTGASYCGHDNKQSFP